MGGACHRKVFSIIIVITYNRKNMSIKRGMCHEQKVEVDYCVCVIFTGCKWTGDCGGPSDWQVELGRLYIYRYEQRAGA